MLKRTIALLLLFALWVTAAQAWETESMTDPEKAAEAAETGLANGPEDADGAEETEAPAAPEWTAAESAEIPENVRALFDRAIRAPEEEASCRYEPLALLGEADGVYCILCLARPEDPESAPRHVLVYVAGDGVRNTWDLWLEDHAGVPSGVAEDDGAEATVTYGDLVSDLLKLLNAQRNVRLDLETLNDEFSAAIAACWENAYGDDAYALRLYGASDPALLPVEGRHAFVVLGLELADGEMREELKGRCDAAAAAARAFPDSVLVLSGGATGENNPDAHTEAGMMQAYLTERCGIGAERIFTDERALTTVGNAVNTYAILRRLGIESFTLVTSGYHVPRAVLLYEILGLINRDVLGDTPRIVENYAFDAPAPEGTEVTDPFIAAMQLREILDAFSGADETVRTLLTDGGEF